MGRRKPNTNSAAAGIPREYMDMLKSYRKEEKRQHSDNVQSSLPGGPNTKRARTQPTPAEQLRAEEYNFERSPKVETPPPSSQFYESVDEVADDSDSDEDWENVDIVEDDAEDDDETIGPSGSGQQDGEEHIEDLVVTFDKPEPLPKTQKEKTPRPIRLAIHKFCLVGWLLFSRTHNSWINARELYQNNNLRNVLASSIIQEMFPHGEHFTPFLKSKKLVDGLRHAMACWQVRFKVTRPGLCDDKSGGGDIHLDRKGYIDSLLKLTGSSDMMCAGFCALMRSIGLNARLVCSLQPPDINAQGEAPSRKTKRASTKSAPIFWTEVYDRWAEGWIVIDPLTSTVKPVSRTKTKLAIEPGVSDRSNILRYCIAWSRHGSARDVTRRYASQYNARTRKKRITYYEGGEEWYCQLMARFCKTKISEKDVDEFKELYRHELNEGLPTRFQDFVNHPVYVLEEQLHHNQILEPGAHACGTLSLKKTTVKVFRRNQVVTCHSAQSWYRRGFKLRERAQPRLRREIKNRLTGDMDDVGLYSPDAVEVYTPEPIGPNGEVPKSQYKTIDLFVPTMLPQGAAYVTHAYAHVAAKLLGIDFANAVTGVEFGRAGPKSVMRGIVISNEFLPAMELVLYNMETIEREQVAAREQLRLLMLWRKYIVAIQIWERIERMNPDPAVKYGGGANMSIDDSANEDSDDINADHNDDDPERDEVEAEFPDPEDDNNPEEILLPYQSDAQRNVMHPSPSSESEDGDDVPWEPVPSDEESTEEADLAPNLDQLGETPQVPESYEPINEQVHVEMPSPNQQPRTDPEDQANTRGQNIRLRIPMYEEDHVKIPPLQTEKSLGVSTAPTPEDGATSKAKIPENSDSSDFPELMDELSESEFD